MNPTLCFQLSLPWVRWSDSWARRYPQWGSPDLRSGVQPSRAICSARPGSRWPAGTSLAQLAARRKQLESLVRKDLGGMQAGFKGVKNEWMWNKFGCGGFISRWYVPERFRSRISHALVVTYDTLTQQKPKLKKLIHKLYVHPWQEYPMGYICVF